MLAKGSTSCRRGRLLGLGGRVSIAATPAENPRGQVN